MVDKYLDETVPNLAGIHARDELDDTVGSLIRGTQKNSLTSFLSVRDTPQAGSPALRQDPEHNAKSSLSGSARPQVDEAIPPDIILPYLGDGPDQDLEDSPSDSDARK